MVKITAILTFKVKMTFLTFLKAAKQFPKEAAKLVVFVSGVNQANLSANQTLYSFIFNA